MKKAITKCQEKFTQLSPVKKSVSNWTPVNILPNLKLNTQTESLFKRKINIFLNDIKFTDVSVTVNEFNDRNLSGNLLLMNFDQNSNSLFQHAISFNQKFQTM